MLKDLIFDMGNVLIEYDPEKMVKQYAPEAEDRQILLQEIFYSEGWKLQDLGILDDEKLYRDVIKRIPSHLHEAASELIFHWHEQMVPIEGMACLISHFKKKGLGIYLLSNAGSNSRIYWDKVPGSACFDGKVISAFEGVTKPDERIYRILLERYGLAVEGCLFIDDMDANIKASEKLGFMTYLFQNDTAQLQRHIETIMEEEERC